jgi:uncharacterized membrane protein YadS
MYTFLKGYTLKRTYLIKTETLIKEHLKKSRKCILNINVALYGFNKDFTQRLKKYGYKQSFMTVPFI